MPRPHKLRVFLCNASQDKQVVQGLYQRLEREAWIGQVVTMSQTIAIGRLRSNNIKLADPTVSRRHAKIAQSKGKYYRVDLGSSVGPF